MASALPNMKGSQLLVIVTDRKSSEQNKQTNKQTNMKAKQ